VLTFQHPIAHATVIEAVGSQSQGRQSRRRDHRPVADLCHTPIDLENRAESVKSSGSCHLESHRCRRSPRVRAVVLESVSAAVPRHRSVGKGTRCAGLDRSGSGAARVVCAGRSHNRRRRSMTLSRCCLVQFQSWSCDCRESGRITISNQLRPTDAGAKGIQARHGGE
jgi:hypothetical protein